MFGWLSFIRCANEVSIIVVLRDVCRQFLREQRVQIESGRSGGSQLSINSPPFNASSRLAVSSTVFWHSSTRDAARCTLPDPFCSAIYLRHPSSTSLPLSLPPSAPLYVHSGVESWRDRETWSYFIEDTGKEQQRRKDDSGNGRSAAIPQDVWLEPETRVQRV